MSYIGNSPGVASQRIVTIRTATAGQTEFFPDSGYVLGYIDVIIGGVDMTPGVDYTANDGVKVVLTEAAEAGEIVKLIAYIPRGLSDGYLKSEADALLALKADLVGGKIPSAQLPAYVDDVLEFDNLASFPATGEFGKIYVDKTTNATYRWSGSTYIVLTDLSAYYTSAQVDSALSTKANTTDVNTALALKANTTDVNTALALKQNNLGFTPVNKAGDTMTGDFSTLGNLKYRQLKFNESSNTMSPAEDALRCFNGWNFKNLGMFQFRYGANYLHLKTNLTSDSIMFQALATGYLYNNGNLWGIIGGYTYAGTIINVYTQTQGNHGFSGVYRASDGSLCFRLSRADTDYTEGYITFYLHTHDYGSQNAAAIIAYAQNTNSGKAF